MLGPLVVAGVLVEETGTLQEIGVKDSKKLSPSRRQGLYGRITEMFEYHSIHLCAGDLDTMMKGMTLNDIEAFLFASVIQELCPENTTVYMDAADVNPINFSRKVQGGLSKRVVLISEHGADDRYPVVSAASIVAKVERDRAMEAIAAEVGMDVGSGYPSDRKTVRFLEEWVSEHGSLPSFARSSWKTSADILGRNKNKKLTDF